MLDRCPFFDITSLDTSYLFLLIVSSLLYHLAYRSVYSSRMAHWRFERRVIELRHVYIRLLTKVLVAGVCFRLWAWIFVYQTSSNVLSFVYTETHRPQRFNRTCPGIRSLHSLQSCPIHGPSIWIMAGDISDRGVWRSYPAAETHRTIGWVYMVSNIIWGVVVTPAWWSDEDAAKKELCDKEGVLWSTFLYKESVSAYIGH